MEKEIIDLQNDLKKHSVYKKLNNIDSIRVFMKYHAFAVWDFMSLLKSLQNKVTSTQVPWTPSACNPEVTRLINEIVVAEESDIDQNGLASSHYELYLKSMEEVAADTSLINSFLQDLDYNVIPQRLAEVIKYHIDIAQNAPVHMVAAAFFYGRENIIPMVFEPISKSIKVNNIDCPTLLYYLDRHIELDGDEHGPKALECISYLCDTEDKKKESIQTAIKSLEMRKKLWDFIEDEIDSFNLAQVKPKINHIQGIPNNDSFLSIKS